MKIRCLANTGKTLSETNLRQGCFRESEFQLSVGKEYVVYAMCVFENALSYLVFNDSRQPDWSPAELFAITDHRLPADWRFNSWGPDLSGVWGYEELVMSREYFDQLAERDEPAILDFHRRRERMEREADANDRDTLQK